MTSVGGDAFYTLKELDGTFKKVEDDLKPANTHRAEVVFSKFGVILSDSKSFASLDLVNLAKSKDDFQKFYSEVLTNNNFGDTSMYGNIKEDITTLPENWKPFLSLNLKTFDAVNKELASQPQIKISAVASFLDSI